MLPYHHVLPIPYLLIGAIQFKSSPALVRRAQIKTEINGVLTWRVLFLSFFLSIAYSVLVVLGMLALAPATASIKPEWLRESIIIFGAALPPISLFIWFCPWLAWRICRPLGLFFFARRLYWFTPGATRRDLKNFQALLGASRGVPPALPPPMKKSLGKKIFRVLLVDTKPLPFLLDAKTTVMLALAGEVLGDYDRAERLLQMFELCPPALKTLGIVRRFGFEELAWHAAKRGDWNAVLRRARMGSGRGMLLMRLLAEKHLARPVRPGALWCALLIAPGRCRALRLVCDAAKPVSGESAQRASSPGGLRRTHMLLLSKASEGISIDMAEVFGLAESWDREFAAHKQDSLLRRGVELGARDVLGLAEKIEQNLLEELEEMAAAAHGEVPREVFAPGDGDNASFPQRLLSRLRSRLYGDIDSLLELFRVEAGQQIEEAKLLERWEIWLSLRESVSGFHRMMGTDELSTLWYGSLRDDVWNSISRIFNVHNYRVAFIAMIMFNWVTEMCRFLGDEEGSAINRNNTRLCRDELLVRSSLRKQISKWAA